MTSRTEIVTLIELGKKILAVPQDKGDQFIAELESYSLQFDTNLSAITPEPAGEELKPLLTELALVHGEILKRADTYKSETAVFLRSMQGKGRGLRAYVDSLPKRISVGRPRKG